LKRIDSIQPELFEQKVFDVRSKKKIAPRVPFSALLENGFLKPGQTLYFKKKKSKIAYIKPDARLIIGDEFEGSIHQAGSYYMNGSPCNGWEHWYLEMDGKMIKLDDFREKYRLEKGLGNG